MQNTKENQATIGNLIDELIDSVVDDNTHDNCVQRQIDKLKQVIFSGGWISVNDELPTISDQYWVAYCAVHKTNRSEKLEFDYCTAHFNEFEKRWYVKDQMFYTQRRCKVVYWQPLPELPQKKTKSNHISSNPIL